MLGPISGGYSGAPVRESAIVEAQRRNGLLLTHRWREMDSNHRSQVTCKLCWSGPPLLPAREREQRGVSNGKQRGSRAGAQCLTSDGATRVGGACLPTVAGRGGAQARCLKRQLSLVQPCFFCASIEPGWGTV
jgi:hypothetical protein